MAHRTGRPRTIPINVERVLFLAATQDAFRERLLADRRTALQEWGLELRPAELAVLDSQSGDSLEAMIASIHPQAQGRRRFMRAVAAASAVGAGVATLQACDEELNTGISPDRPDGQADAQTTDDASPTQ